MDGRAIQLCNRCTFSACMRGICAITAALSALAAPKAGRLPPVAATNSELDTPACTNCRRLRPDCCEPLMPPPSEWPYVGVFFPGQLKTTTRQRAVALHRKLRGEGARGHTEEAGSMLTGRILACAITSAVLTFPAAAAGASTFDAASAFGARTGVTNLQMSPDGSSVVYVAPVKGRGSAAYTLNLAKGSVAHVALAVDGNPFGLRQCRWVANDRIVCIIYGVVPDPSLHL